MRGDYRPTDWHGQAQVSIRRVLWLIGVLQVLRLGSEGKQREREQQEDKYYCLYSHERGSSHQEVVQLFW